MNAPIDSPPEPPKEPPAPKSSWKLSIGKALSAVAVLAASSFLLVSETFIKNYVNSWATSCLFVIEKDHVRGDRFRVRGYLSGKAPTELPITFSAPPGATINRVHMINEVLMGEGRGSIAVHPQTSFACPGAFCEALGADAAAPKQTIVLTDLHADFLYAFHVDLSRAVKGDDLNIFVQFNSATEQAVCRVEDASGFNLWVRLSKFSKFLLLLAVFAAASLVVIVLRAKGTPK